MIVKPLLIVLFFALSGCGSTPEIPAKPGEQPKAQEPQPATESPEALPVASLKNRMVEAAKNEWTYFGQQIVVIDGDEESIPQVGIWEDDNAIHSDRVNQYWRAAGKYRLSGNDCKQPYSAAFISWVMRAAGVPEYQFPTAINHRSYLSRFLAESHNPYAAFVPHTIREYKPKPGDLICANRGGVTPTEVIEELPDSLNTKLHCDIVVETQGQTLQSIGGGNVRNSVSKTVLTLSPEGYLQVTRPRPWFLIIENRLD
ncbi:MAG: DUF2272 domain-containing protein [Methylomonas sp.]